MFSTVLPFFLSCLVLLSAFFLSFYGQLCVGSVAGPLCKSHVRFKRARSAQQGVTLNYDIPGTRHAAAVGVETAGAFEGGMYMSVN